MKNNTTSYTGLAFDDLEKVTENLILYLTGSKKNLNMEFPVNGQSHQIFNEREKAHMIDVVGLFSFLINAMYVLVILVIIFLSSVIIFNKSQLSSVLSKGFVVSSVGFYAIVAIIGTIISLNFSWFWESFHKIVFTNDLWLLDPNNSIMINMFPLEFFYGCCFRILLIFSVVMVILTAVSILTLKLQKNKKLY